MAFRKQTIGLISAIILMQTLSGCKPGPIDRFDPMDLGFLIKGHTNEQEVIAKLGQPTTSSVSHTGQHQMSWTYNKAAVDGKTYLPFAGALVGKGVAETKGISAEFDQRGILTHFARSAGGTQHLVDRPQP
ncbi:MAG: hypothetical protein BWK72_19085 [Rhodoferax ferrireducens]|uniref:Lipoprotein SmpA/OmlA domain-containing protein n=1 Tax=Rhodoferax ferrireducens TaxID=192843 RepID=A0A1W9KPE7_9BURK|nr:MAG: hypothetical protein BWK72_19085 [Rhodoferax ferrireducens]